MQFAFLEKRRAATNTFHEMVEQRGQSLRTLSYEQLIQLADEPVTEFVLGGRKGRIGLIVEDCSEDRVKIVVQGFLYFKHFSRMSSVFLHGFYKHRDGAISEMKDEEFNAYD